MKEVWKWVREAVGRKLKGLKGSKEPPLPMPKDPIWTLHCFDNEDEGWNDGYHWNVNDVKVEWEYGVESGIVKVYTDCPATHLCKRVVFQVFDHNGRRWMSIDHKFDKPKPMVVGWTMIEFDSLLAEN